jgi:predicted nucleotide-binding protein
MLVNDLSADIWNQAKVFSLTNTTIESLEDAVLQYDYGIFVLTKDDTLKSRGRHRDVARDNVIFELGLFMGQLTRRRVILVQAQGVSMPTDLLGLTTARYRQGKENLTKALNPAVLQIRSVLGRCPWRITELGQN